MKERVREHNQVNDLRITFPKNRILMTSFRYRAILRSQLIDHRLLPPPLQDLKSDKLSTKAMDAKVDDRQTSIFKVTAPPRCFTSIESKRQR
jgi:hypothetical protein